MLLKIEFGPQTGNLSDYADIANVAIAALALFVAGLSIFFSRRSLKHQENHDKLTVRPIPYILFSNYENLIAVRIRNYGVGPLIIKKFIAESTLENHGDVISFMPDLPEGVYWRNFTARLEDRPIPPDGDIILLEYECDYSKILECDFRDDCRKILSDLTFSLEYTDVYNQDFPMYVRDGGWFNQHDLEKRTNK